MCPLRSTPKRRSWGSARMSPNPTPDSAPWRPRLTDYDVDVVVLVLDIAPGGQAEGLVSAHLQNREGIRAGQACEPWCAPAPARAPGNPPPPILTLQLRA